MVRCQYLGRIPADCQAENVMVSNPGLKIVSRSVLIHETIIPERQIPKKRQRLDKANRCREFVVSLMRFERTAFRLGARRFAVAPCRSVSIFVAGYGTFLRVRVDSCRFLSLTVLPCRRVSFSLILVFSKNGKRVAVEFKSFLAGPSVSGS